MDLKRELSDIVGAQWVNMEDGVLEGYAKDESFISARRPQCVVKPGTVREVQDVILWANRTKVPLIPVSSGQPHFRGDTIPRMGGAVVDMERMNTIIRINRKNRVAVIEPGVTFEQLMSEVEKEGMRLAMPLLPRSNKSVLASVLEREPPLMPRHHWDISDPLCCMEVVFGSGDLFRTGEASGPSELEAQWNIGNAQKFPLGPHQVDYHRLVQGAQGTMGIATWASIKCELRPPVKRAYFVTSQRIGELFEFTYELLKQGYGEELFVLNNIQLAALMKGKGSTAHVDEIAHELPTWILVFCIAGGERYPEAQLEYLEIDIRNIAQGCGITPQNLVGKISSSDMLAVLDACSRDSYWKCEARGAFQDIFFLTTLDRSLPYIDAMYQTARGAGVPDAHIGVYIQPIVQGTSCHCEFTLYYNPEDEQEVARAKGLFHSASSRMIQEGAFFSRPYPSWAEEVYARRAESASALRKVKSVFDPNHIMNPGKLCF